MSRPVLCPTTLLLLSVALPIAVWAGEDLSRNGNCEIVENGKPVGWGPYLSGVKWGALEAGYEGKGVWFEPEPFKPIDSGDRKGENYVNSGLTQGSSSGTSGADALVVEPPPYASYYRRPPAGAYRVSFWIKSECNKINVNLQGWTTEEATPSDRAGTTLIPHIGRLDEWTYFEATANMQPGVQRFAVYFQVWGYEKDGLELGRVCIDELRIERVEPLSADSLRRIEIPSDPAVYVGDTPLEEVLAAYRAGDKATIARVQTTLTSADAYADRGDEWFRQFYRDFEPRGIYTVACPIHPFKTRYYNDFLQDLEHPWVLECKHCKAEGRKYSTYPNPDYPDDGQGCAPTDEVWARDHDAEWSKAHRGIPHDHWDGSSHGYSESRRYYFLGKYYANAMRTLEGSVGPLLATAWHYATELFEEGSPERQRADLYAHKAQVILLCSARAYLGDDYLAAAEGITPEQFRQRMAAFYRPSEGTGWQYEKLSGFREFDNYDRVEGDAVWEGQTPRDARIYPGSWNWRANIAGDLFELFCIARASFTTETDDIRRICERPVVSLEGDREKLAMGQDPPAHYLKRGCFEMEMHPFNLDSGGDNLLSATIAPRIRCAQFLRDDEIMENVARDITYFWRNYFSADGLGYEGSPTYSAYGVATLGEKLYGVKGAFDVNAAYYDAEVGGLNLLGMPVYINCACKYPYYVTDDDDHFISWEDSCYGAQRGTAEIARIEKYGGGVPEKHRKYYDFAYGDDGTLGGVSFDRSRLLPSLMLHDRRKAILRAGRVQQPAVVSLDFTKVCGHYHDAAQTLMVHACGQELASDLGYMGSTHFLTTQWIRTWPAHNCLCIRGADGSPSAARHLRGDLRKHFIVTPRFQLVDTAEYDAADWADFGSEQVGENGRLVLLASPSEEHQYVVDMARGKGGATHDYYLHSHGLAFETDGIDLSPVADAEQDLYEYSGWTFPCGAGYGAHNITELTSGKGSGVWRATWSRIDDYRGRDAGDPMIDEEAFMRLWMVDTPGSEVIVGTAPAQRYLHNQDIGRTMKVLCARRPNTDAVDVFSAVIEPYRTTPFIRRVRPLELQGGDEYCSALAVETIHGTDYFISYGGPGVPPEVSFEDDGHSVSTDADVAVISFAIEGKSALLLAGGSYLRADEYEVRADGPAQLRGSLLDFNDIDDTLTIQSDGELPPGDTLAGQPIIVQHAEDRSTYTIGSVEPLGGGRFLIRLDDEPHLVNNWLNVTQVDQSGIVVEPPPVLDGKRRTYKVYAGDPASPRLLGPLVGIAGRAVYSETGTLMHSFQCVQVGDTSGVEPGQEIGITRMEKGRDTVFVTNFAYLETG